MKHTVRKTFTALVTILLVLLTLCSCGKRSYLASAEFDTDEYLADFDADNRYFSHDIQLMFAERGNYIYSAFMNQNFRYFDLNTGEYEILCAKPDCTHTDKKCDAFNEGSRRILSFYDGRIWWVGTEPRVPRKPAVFRLFSDSLTCGERKAVLTIPTELVTDYQPAICAVHRGYLYIAGCQPRTVDAKYGTAVNLTAMPIDGSTEAFEIFNKFYDGITKRFVRYIANYVYIAAGGQDWIEVYRFDSKTRKLETLYTGNETGVNFANFWVTQNREMFYSGTAKKTGYVFAIEDGSVRKTVEVTSNESRVITDVNLGENTAVVLFREDDAKYKFVVTDLQGNERCTTEILLSECLPGAAATGEGKTAVYSLSVFSCDTENVNLFCLCNQNSIGEDLRPRSDKYNYIIRCADGGRGDRIIVAEKNEDKIYDISEEEE